MTLQQIIAYSGDSELKSYSFSNGIIEVTVDIDYLEETVIFSIPTEVMQISSSLTSISSVNEHLRTCYLKLIDLMDVASTRHGIIVPSIEFGSFMKETRMGLNLVYGKRIKEVRWLFCAVGISRLIICATPDISKIEWRKADA